MGSGGQQQQQGMGSAPYTGAPVQVGGQPPPVNNMTGNGPVGMGGAYAPGVGFSPGSQVSGPPKPPGTEPPPALGGPPPNPGAPPGGSTGQPPTGGVGGGSVGGVNPAQQTGGGVAPGLNQAYQQNQNIVGGQYLNPQSNQYLQSYYNAAAQPLIQQFQQSTDPSILGNAVKSGNIYSSAPQQTESNAQTALAQGLGNLGANIYEPAYQQERQLQQQAINSAPGLASAQYLPAQELQGIGGQQQQLQQSIMNFPWQLLSGGAGLVSPGTGGTGTQISTGQQPGSMK